VRGLFQQSFEIISNTCWKNWLCLCATEITFPSLSFSLDVWENDFIGKDYSVYYLLAHCVKGSPEGGACNTNFAYSIFGVLALLSAREFWIFTKHILHIIKLVCTSNILDHSPIDKKIFVKCKALWKIKYCKNSKLYPATWAFRMEYFINSF
jgi:hypothetical protein